VQSQEKEALLNRLQEHSFGYFLDKINPENGPVADNTKDGAPASIAGVGLALSSYPVGVERGFISRAVSIQRTLATLRFFERSPQGAGPQAVGLHGFYYHFLDMHTGTRYRASEVSTIDSGVLLGGALYAAMYFERDEADEREIRALAHELFRRADWQWAMDGGPALTHGWTPERGYIPYRWTGYNEALFLYVLALGSQSYPIAAESYREWLSSYAWKNVYGIDYLYGGPLFMHQYPHVWLDLRGIRDEAMRAHDSDYFENSRRATYVQQEYAIRYPLAFRGYGESFWGLTASEGPGNDHQIVDGIERNFYDYVARGAPYGPDDGSVAPWAAIASLPFAPEIVLPSAANFIALYPDITDSCGCRATVNPTYPTEDARGWVSPNQFALNQGPVVTLIENYRSDLLWRLARRCPYRTRGLRRAGFKGGWLDEGA
jgi:hypothetical protein